MNTMTPFATACFDTNTISELETALRLGPDQTDCETWGITAEQWRQAVETALHALRQVRLAVEGVSPTQELQSWTPSAGSDH